MMTIERKPPLGKKVQLMATCLCDAFHDDAAIATVQVLEHLGCTVEFPEAQTCCGQPAFNAGDWTASRRVVRHMVRTFRSELPVVVPSGSCAAMVFHGALLEFEHEPDRPEVEQLGRRTWELADFIVNGLGVTRLARAVRRRHRVSPLLPHARDSHSAEAAATLLGSIAGVTPRRIRRGRAVLRIRRHVFRGVSQHLRGDGPAEARARARREARLARVGAT